MFEFRLDLLGFTLNIVGDEFCQVETVCHRITLLSNSLRLEVATSKRGKIDPV